jgi:hypothetical protein
VPAAVAPALATVAQPAAGTPAVAMPTAVGTPALAAVELAPDTPAGAVSAGQGDALLRRAMAVVRGREYEGKMTRARKRMAVLKGRKTR